MSVLIASINMFSEHSSLFSWDEETNETKFVGEIPLHNIKNLTGNLFAIKPDVDEVILTGAPADYLRGVRGQLMSESINSYNKRIDVKIWQEI